MLDARRAVWALSMRGWRAVLRRPVALSFSVAQPLIWMTFFGFLFRRAVGPSALEGQDYLSFVAPGVSLMAVVFGASQAGVSLVRDAQTGMLARMLHSPTAAGWLLWGKLRADVQRYVLAALLVLALAHLLGAQLTFTLAGLLPGMVAVAALAIALSSLSCAIALWTRAPESMGTYVHLINMPLLFTSTALVPGRHLPAWLASAAAVNPLSLAAGHWRALWLDAAVGEGLPWLIGLAGVAFTVATLAMRAARLRA